MFATIFNAIEFYYRLQLPRRHITTAGLRKEEARRAVSLDVLEEQVFSRLPLLPPSPGLNTRLQATPLSHYGSLS
ncbi:uncharacterized protein ARMOST_19970 [Armillaria ostoyae]|uniref:Uncharacterized protein n=1 Tax=Armillaria ostoyae TaxID=47428 RepID=A0A284S656_ARMOS|nr:uncharacterized protein ARMOST_19970 [Armillaria ostoyae]